MPLSRADVFGGPPPEGYETLRSGKVSLAETGHEGRYVMMRNPSRRLMALVVESRPADHPAKMPGILETDDAAALTDYLFRHYVELDNYEIRVESRKWVALGDGHYPADRLRVRFNDAFEEADWITRIEYPRHKQLILLLGRPQTGRKADCPSLHRDFQAMEDAARELFVTGGFEEEQEDTGPHSGISSFLRNLLRIPHRNCF